MTHEAVGSPQTERLRFPVREAVGRVYARVGQDKNTLIRQAVGALTDTYGPDAARVASAIGADAPSIADIASDAGRLDPQEVGALGRIRRAVVDAHAVNAVRAEGAVRLAQHVISPRIMVPAVALGGAGCAAVDVPMTIEQPPAQVAEYAPPAEDPDGWTVGPTSTPTQAPETPTPTPTEIPTATPTVTPTPTPTPTPERQEAFSPYAIPLRMVVPERGDPYYGKTIGGLELGPEARSLVSDLVLKNLAKAGPLQDDFDLNKDGTVSEAEVAQYLARHAGRLPPDTLIPQQAVNVLDASGRPVPPERAVAKAMYRLPDHPIDLSQGIGLLPLYAGTATADDMRYAVWAGNTPGLGGFRFVVDPRGALTIRFFQNTNIPDRMQGVAASLTQFTHIALGTWGNMYPPRPDGTMPDGSQDLAGGFLAAYRQRPPFNMNLLRPQSAIFMLSDE